MGCTHDDAHVLLLSMNRTFRRPVLFEVWHRSLKKGLSFPCLYGLSKKGYGLKGGNTNHLQGRGRTNGRGPMRERGGSAAAAQPPRMTRRCRCAASAPAATGATG